MGTHLLCLLPTQNKGKDGKGMERKRKTEHNDLLPKKGNPLHETVCYKIGGTVFEIETSCGGSELLYDKMKRLIKSETVKTPTDKEMTERYNSDSNLFVGRSLQEEWTMTTTKNYPDSITALYARLSQEDALDGESNLKTNILEKQFCDSKSIWV